MLPGKKYKPEDMLQVLRRRIWLILVPFAVVSAGTAVVVRKLPDRYRSEATIQVEPQRVPEAYVRSSVTTDLRDRLRTIQVQIMSRTRLERIIEEYNLYLEQRRTGLMEDVVERMRGDIIVGMKQGDVFSVAYYGDNPRTVMKVADRLASLFIDENTQERARLADGTSQFLESTVEEARRRLADSENKLREYKLKYTGQLPQQLEANLQAMSQTMNQVQQLNDGINRDREQKLFIEKQLKELEADPGMSDLGPQATLTPATAENPGRVTGGSAAQQLALAKAYLAQLQGKYSDTYPDVKTWKRIVQDAQEKADAEALSRPVTLGDSGLPPAEAARRGKIQQARTQIDLLERQIADRQAQDARLRKVALDLQQRIDAAPARDSEMTEMTRDYGTLTSLYTSFLSKKEDAQIATNLERRQIGENFKLLDPARLPQRPSSPDRPRLNMLGMLAGAGLGLALIALLEYRDVTFKTDEEITTHLSFPVLAVVPVMQSDQDRRRAQKRKWITGVALGSTVAGCMAVLLYTFVR